MKVTLDRHDVVAFDPKREQHYITIELFRRWVQRYHPYNQNPVGL